MREFVADVTTIILAYAMMAAVWAVVILIAPFVLAGCVRATWNGK